MYQKEYIFKYQIKGAADYFSLFRQPVIGNLTQSKQDFLARSKFSNYMGVGVGVVIMVCSSEK